MAQPIKHIKQYKQGVGFIELIVYMGIFMILLCGVLYTALYLGKILEYNTLEYKAGEQIYRQLDLLQQHLVKATKVEVGSSSLKVYGSYGYIEHYIQDNILHMKYVYVGKADKDMIVYPYVKFEKFSFVREVGHETMFGNSVIWVEVKRVDSRGRVKVLKEWLLNHS